jgi:hypothetical protein
VDTLHTQAEAADTLVAFAEAADTLAALAEAHIEPAVVAADRLLPLAEAHTVSALVPAAGRLAGPGTLQPPEQFARHPQLAG